MPGAPLFTAVALTLALAPSACSVLEPKTCTLVGCSNEVTTLLDVPLALEDLDGTRLAFCHNERCVFAALAQDPGGERVDCVVTVSEAGSLFCSPPIELTPSSVRLMISYTTRSRDDFRDGDAFSLRLMDASMSVSLAEKAGTIPKYESAHPNGKDCDGDDYCRSGSF